MKKTFLILSSLLLWTSLQAQDYIIPMRKIQTAVFALNSFYVDSVDNEKLINEAMKSIVKNLDPHSEYMSKEEVSEMNEPLQGGFDGIGISFNMMNDTLFIVEVITGGPSEKVGLLAGDRILSVDDEVIAGVKMSNKEVMKRLKGPKGTLVRIGVKRRGEPELLEFRIIRDKIPLYSLDAAFMADKKTGYIRLSRFSATTMKEFKEAFEELRQQGMEQLILDLQSNGGGYMNTAVELADEFLPKGRSVVYTEGLNSPRYQADASERGSFEKGNLIVLIDEYSASSSEIVAGAVQDWDRGLIIGRRSFGKGLVQRIFPLGDGTALKLTVSRYYTPSGRCIQKPYREGVEAYGRDLIERYNRGEMSSADSIHFPDSLRYSTMIEKRTVYGGGGIMPDVFVPVDTSRYTDLHRELVNKGILNRFILTYVDENRRALLDKYGDNSQEFIREFQFDDVLLEELFKLAIKENVKITDEHRQEDLSVLRLQCKAYMARDLWKSADYYKVMAPLNESLQEALRILGDKKLKARYGLL